MTTSVPSRTWRVGRWVFTVLASVCFIYLLSTSISWWHTVQRLVPSLSSSDTSHLAFYSQRSWPSAKEEKVASPGDLYLAEQILSEMDKGLGQDERMMQTTVVRIMNDHLVNPSWYTWIRPQIVALTTPSASPTPVDTVGVMIRPDMRRYASILRDSADAWLVHQAYR